MSNDRHRARYAPLWLIPNLTIFFSSACIMTMELVAGRLIARHVGMSLYTWTAIIGVVMAGISLGNHVGGRMADRYAPRRALAVLFLCAALGCAAILPLNMLAGGLGFLRLFSWPVRVFLHVFLAFFAPSTLLGMINPVVAKMALDYNSENAGRALGGVFAWGVAGSLVGTFLTGYYLVMVLGAATIVAFSAVGLALLGLCYALVELVVRRRVPTSLANSVRATVPDAVPFHSSAKEWVPAALTVFTSNAAFMIFELAAMRVVAREFGSSLYTWTTVIGLVLAGISLGNYLGGRLADRSFSRGRIAGVFSLSAIAVLCSPACAAFISAQRGEMFLLAQLSWPMQIFIHVAAVCFVPCVFIGMVSPIVTRRLLESGRAPGASVGIVYAWGSIGAIAGTFLAGYSLLQWLGSLSVIALVSVLLAGVACVYAPRRWWSVPVAFCALVALLSSFASVPALGGLGAFARLRHAPNPRIVYEDESQYSYIAILEDPDDPEIREMLLDQLVHTRIDMRDPTLLLYEYEWVYSAVMAKRHPMPAPVRALVIGGGGYAYPHYLEVARPGSEITVAEIDPAVTEAAHVALALPRDTSMRIYDMDARNVVDDLIREMRSNADFQKFDYIFGDSINDYTVPYHLTTVEFKRMLRELLTENGVYLFNMIDMFDSGAFLAAVVNTCRQVFDQVVVFNTGRPAFIRDTFVVVCSDAALFLGDIPLRLQARYEYLGVEIAESALDALIDRHDGIVLSDDFAPVENLLAPVVRTRAGDTGEINLRFARRYAARGDLDAAVRRTRAALEVHPRWPEAHAFLAQLLQQRGDVDESIQALRAAVEANPDVAGWYSLGMALMSANRHDEAMDAWRECVRLQPDHVGALYNLGVLYGMANALPEAIAAWRQALEHAPEHADTLHNLALAYVMIGNKADARALLERMQSLNHTIAPELLDALKE